MAAMLAAPASAKELDEYDWVEVETEHFVMRSIRGKRATLKYARELTMFINVIPKEIREIRRDRPGKMTLYLLRDTTQVDELIYGDRHWLYTNPALYWDHGARTVVMGLFTDVRRNLDYVYARYLFGGGGSEVFGDEEMLQWWQEGFIHYYSSTDTRRGYYYFGTSSRSVTDSPEEYRETLDAILNPVSRLDLSTDQRISYVFYSHRLLRFLMDSRESWADLGDRLNRYIRLTGSGTAFQSAFEEAFEMSMDELAAALSKHSQNCCTRYKIPLEAVEKGFDPQVRELDRETIRQALNEITERAQASQPDE